MKLSFVVLIALLLLGCAMHKQVDAFFDHWYAIWYQDGFQTITKGIGVGVALIIFAIFGESMYNGINPRRQASAQASFPADQHVA